MRPLKNRPYCKIMLTQRDFLPQNYAAKHKSNTFASVFHGIRFKVRRLFVATTSNFFLRLRQDAQACTIPLWPGLRGITELAAAPAASVALIATRRIFPEMVFGNSFTNSITRGYL